MDCSLPGSSIHGIFQAIVLEWEAISFARASSLPRDQTWVSPIVDRCFTIWATREVLSFLKIMIKQWVGKPQTGKNIKCKYLKRVYMKNIMNPRDGRICWAAICGVTQSRTQLSDFTFTFDFRALEKSMAPHSSTLAWKIPWMEEPGRL